MKLKAPCSFLTVPPILFFSVWIIVVLLFSLHIAEFYQKMNLSTALFLLGILFDFVITYHIAKTRSHYLSVSSNESNVINIIERKTKRFSKWLWIGVFMSVLYAKGVPLLWLLTGDGRTYLDFGIPSINGFLNALFYISIVSYGLLFIKTKSKKYIKQILFLLAYAILIVSRGLLFAAIFELLGLHLLFYSLKVKRVVMLVVFAVLLSLLFGYIGDNRYGSEYSQEKVLRSVVDSKYEDVMTSLPSGITWVYIYSTCAINNVVYNIDRVQPLYYPQNTVRRLVPSVIANMIWGEVEYEKRYSFEMDNELFNVFTIFSNYIKDFGLIGTIIVFFFIAYWFNSIYVGSQKGRLDSIMMYPVVFMVICLSIFDDYFTSLPTIAQLLITYYSYKGIKITNI